MYIAPVFFFKPDICVCVRECACVCVCVCVHTIFTDFIPKATSLCDSFGGLVVCVLASGSRVRGFEPGRSCWIFSV
jgi:hypothetical protein